MAENKKYDLEERTTKFAEAIIELCKKTNKNSVTSPLVSQLVRAGTSIGANYHEANGASSKKDFINKIYICKKESRETKYWLNLISKALPEVKEDCLKLTNEAQELTLIFSRITLTAKNSVKI